MVTEKEIVYNILNTARNEEHNVDEVISERLMRGYLRVHRASLLNKYYKNGHTFSDEIFQNVPIEITEKNGEYIGKLPDIIRANKGYGFYAEMLGVRVPILNNEEYYLSKNSNNTIYSTSIGNQFKLRVNAKMCGCGEYNDMVRIVEYFYQKQLKAKKEGVNIEDLKYEINIIAVLQNPSDDPNYDWEKSIYPFPPEMLEDLKYEVLRREINIMPHMRRDEIANSRNDSLNNRTSNVSAQESA